MKNRSKSESRRRLKRAIENKRRREINRQMKSYICVRKKKIGSLPQRESGECDDRSPADAEVLLADEIAFARCDGVGTCCIGQPLALEPADIIRIVQCENVREVLNVKDTGDLYVAGENEKPILLHFFDHKARVPVCFAVPKQLGPGDERTICPFYQMGPHPQCLLGDDRPTQCRSHPVARLARITEGRQIGGWTYRLHDVPCMGCQKDNATDRRIMRVDEWLRVCGMTGENGRYYETDLYVAFCDWLRRAKFPTQLNQLASAVLFDWGRIAEEAPGDVFSLISFARLSLERLEKEGMGSLLGGAKE